MVPTLKIPKDALKSNNFLNAYIEDNRKKEQYTDCIYLLFKPLDFDKFREFLDSEYERSDNVIDDYDYEKGYVVVVYKLNEDYKEDFSLIREGKYSKTSSEFQSLFSPVLKIIKNGLHRDEMSLQYRIFKKTTDLIEFWETTLEIVFEESQEVWDGFNEKKEILNLTKIIENE